MLQAIQQFLLSLSNLQCLDDIWYSLQGLQTRTLINAKDILERQVKKVWYVVVFLFSCLVQGSD